MHIRYELTSDDLLTFSKEAIKGTSYYNVQVAIFAIVGLIFMSSDLLLIVASVFLNDGSISVGDPLLMILIKLVLWLVLIVLLVAVLTFFSKREMNKSLVARGINGVFCEHLVELAETGFTESTAVNRGFHAWKGVESIRETESLVLITVRLGSIYIIPKRAFGSDEERSAFTSAVNGHIVQASVPPPPTYE